MVKIWDMGDPKKSGNSGRWTSETAPRNKPGTPGIGRPKGLAAKVREMTGDFTYQVGIMMDCARGALKGATARDRLEAIKWLADRGYGKAVETAVQIQGELEQVDLGDMSTEDLVSVLRHIRAVKAEKDKAPETKSETPADQTRKAG